MADGVGYSAGSGTTIATDDCGASGHVQIIKLAISSDGSVTYIPADATYGIDVDVTRFAPGTDPASLGKAEDAAHASGDTGVMALAVRKDTAAASSGTTGDYEPLSTDDTGNLRTLASLNDGSDNAMTLGTPIVISQTPTLDTSVYAAGDSMWGTAAIEFANAVQTSGGTAHITKLAVYDDSDNGTAGDFKLWLFKSNVASQAANSAWSLTDANMDEVVAVIDTADGTWYDAVNGQVCFVYPAPPLSIDADATSIYGHGVVDSDKTPTFAANSLEIKLHLLRD